MPVTPPATCETVISIESPHYRQQALAALGIWSHALGITFIEGDDPTLRLIEASPIPVPGYEHIAGVFNGDVIYLQAAKYAPRYATYIFVHEIGHWLRMEHNHRPGSIMNLGSWPQRPSPSRSDIAEAKRLTAYCR